MWIRSLQSCFRCSPASIASEHTGGLCMKIRKLQTRKIWLILFKCERNLYRISTEKNVYHFNILHLLRPISFLVHNRSFNLKLPFVATICLLNIHISSSHLVESQSWLWKIRKIQRTFGLLLYCKKKDIENAVRHPEIAPSNLCSRSRILFCTAVFITVSFVSLLFACPVSYMAEHPSACAPNYFSVEITHMRRIRLILRR